MYLTVKINLTHLFQVNRGLCNFPKHPLSTHSTTCVNHQSMVSFRGSRSSRSSANLTTIREQRDENSRKSNRIFKRTPIDILVRPISIDKQQRQPRVSTAQAHDNLIYSLQQPLNSEQASAMQRLQYQFSFPKDSLNPELLTQAMSDLDTVLFQNILQGKMKIEWADLLVTRRRMLHGICLPYDIGWSGITKVRIRLNKAMLRMLSKETIWGALVHEMLHGYLDLSCSWSLLTVPHHGSLFDRSCEALVRRLDFQGLTAEHVI